jgi:hypothetical protein
MKLQGWVMVMVLGMGACSSSPSTEGPESDAALSRTDSSQHDATASNRDATSRDASSGDVANRDASSDAASHDASKATKDASSAPSAAAAVGYNTQTFDSTKLGTTAGTWQNFNYFGVKQPPGACLQNPDGSLGLTGNSGDSYGAVVCTAAYDDSMPEKFQGIAFGGGGYFEATLSFVGTPDGTDSSPAFWAVDVEHASGYLPITAGNTWAEVDDLETDVASDNKWGQSLHNWYNAGSGHIAANPPAILHGNPVTIPDGGNFNQSHTYAFLWVPATSATQGYLKFFCDGAQIGGAAFWNKYDPTQPFPPSGDDIGNILDTLHLNLILGSDSTSYPATVTSVQVWQASAADNLTY